jgi:hypothetical protein
VIDAEHDTAVRDLVLWLRGQPECSQPFASPAYWAQLCYLGAA